MSQSLLLVASVRIAICGHFFFFFALYIFVKSFPRVIFASPNFALVLRQKCEDYASKYGSAISDSHDLMTYRSRRRYTGGIYETSIRLARRSRTIRKKQIIGILQINFKHHFYVVFSEDNLESYRKQATGTEE